MNILTSQQIHNLYERFKTTDVTFSKGTIQVTGLVAKQIYLKCMGGFWPCVLYSSSFETAKIVANINTGLIEKLQDAKQSASIRFCFKPDASDGQVFFVNVRSVGFAPYAGSKQVAIFTFQYTQRPPDYLIEILGRYLDANENSTKRNSERIPITPDSMRKLSLEGRESVVLIDGTSRNCILCDISFFGAKIIVMGVTKYLEAQEVQLQINFNIPQGNFTLKGHFVRSEQVEGRPDLLSLGLAFDLEDIPIGYKMHINDFISQIRQARVGTVEEIVV
ncbi:MAG: PilZ domain-containing protein [Treponema sp.]|jgi:hypothetical protein|nr:PilZ domain-containing protein [Treponema sp.]